MRNYVLFLMISINITLSSQIPEGLPGILETENDRLISEAKIWEKQRRPEILEVFRNEIYGKFPAEFNPEIRFEEISTSFDALDGHGIRKQVRIHLKSKENNEHLSIDLLIYLPYRISGKTPLFLGLNFYGNHTIHPDPGIIISDSWVRDNEAFRISDNLADERSRGVRVSRWPVEYILSRGYGLATIYYGDIDPDFDDDFNNGLHKLFRESGPYPVNGAGSIAAWAYGLSRAMDYFEIDDNIDENRVVVFGHSRLGKASLWAGVRDERFALVISNNSGCGGAALSMRKHGETVKNINDQFPHWFCDNFKKYNENEDELPVDQHMLLALIAPRPIYLASAQEDNWADPYGEQLSGYLAGKVYEQLYNLEVRIPKDPLSINYPVKSGAIGYHIRTGKHNITGYDWEQFLDFSDLFFRD